MRKVRIQKTPLRPCQTVSRKNAVAASQASSIILLVAILDVIGSGNGLPESDHDKVFLPF